MQRTARVRVTESAVHGNGVTATTTTVRRKVRRRKIRSSSMNVEEVQSLLLVALATACLTAALVWMSAKIYTTVFFSNTEGYTKKFGRRNHHVHTDKSHGNKKNKHHDPNDPHEKSEMDDDWDILPFNKIYHIPEAMETLGDRSDEYATLRKEIDEVLPVDPVRSMARLKELTQNFPELSTYDMVLSHGHSDELHKNTIDYDIYNCPDTPPEGYPFEWKLYDDLLSSWPVLEVDNPPSKIHQGLCVFDFELDHEKALAYRKAEVPFVVINDPEVARTVERWNIPGYLSNMLGKDVKHRAEYNTNSHFLYHAPVGKKRRKNMRDRPRDKRDLQDYQGRQARLQRTDVVPDQIRMTYDEWLEKANKTHVGPEEEHWYFRLIGCGYMGPE